MCNERVSIGNLLYYISLWNEELCLYHALLLREDSEVID